MLGWVKLNKRKWHVRRARKGRQRTDTSTYSFSCFSLDHLSPAAASCFVLFLWLLMKADSCPASCLILWLASWTLPMEAADSNAEAYIFTFMVCSGSAHQQSWKTHPQFKLPDECFIFFIHIHTEAHKLDRPSFLLLHEQMVQYALVSKLQFVEGWVKDALKGRTPTMACAWSSFFLLFLLWLAFYLDDLQRTLVN